MRLDEKNIEQILGMASQTLAPGEITTIDDAKREIAKTREMMEAFKTATSAPAAATFDAGFSQIIGNLESLFQRTQAIIEHCTQIIESDSFPEGETISAVATLISANREIISDIAAIYKERLKFYQILEIDKMRLAHKKELIQFKLQEELKHNAITVSPQGTPIGQLPWRAEDIVMEALKDVQESQ
jgi:hypothetical protein